MYLKALELQGFKSFPEKTRLTFEKDITAIVGPNGSGKSNISDAILWVMGEQRTKALRGGKMEDVVFGGTETRPKMGFAQVSLILDNSGRFFDTDSSELMITRRYYRSGESEYYINRESVRLKDITQLLMDTGLGRNGYSIIGQGKISEVVAAKSGDRRELFEEAAGISRYRSRKDESERKLMHTQENLIRINDKIDELKIQVDPLREQAETAKKYLVLRDELRLMEVSVWMETLDRLAERSQTIQSDWEKAVADIEKAKNEQAELYAASENYSEKMRERDMEAEQVREELSGTELSAAELESELAVLENNDQHNLERQRQLFAEIDEQGTRVSALENQVNQRHERIEEIKNELQALDADVKEITRQMNESLAGEDDVRREMALLLEKKSELQADHSQSSTVISMLADSFTEQEQARLHHDETVSDAKSRSDELDAFVQQHQKELDEAQESVSSLSNVISGYKIRIEGREKKALSLREKMTSITIELGNISSRASMLADMEKEYEGYSKSVKTVMRESARGSLHGVHGPVANLVKAPDRFALAIETALGGAMQSIVVDTQEQGKNAIELLKRQDAGRATFLPINTIKSSELRRSPSGEEGYLGTAFELAEFDEKFRSIFSNLLARTVVAETLGDAVRMSKKFDNQLRIVTLDGQQINAGGSMTGGSAARNTGILSRANELKKLNEKKLELEKSAAETSAELKKAEHEFNQTRYEIQTAELEMSAATDLQRECKSELERTVFLRDEMQKSIRDLETSAQNAELRLKDNRERSQAEKKRKAELERELNLLDEKLEAISRSSRESEQASRVLGDKLSAIAEKRSALSSESDTTLSSIAQLTELFDDHKLDVDSRRQTIERLGAERGALLHEKTALTDKISTLREHTDEIRAKLQGIISNKLELEGKRTQSEKRSQEKNNELLSLERTNAAIEQKKLSAELEEKQIIDKLWDSYELSRSAAAGIRQPVENMGASTKRIGTIKREISSLGTPNLGAIDEYERVSTRYNFLTEQRDDIEKAKRELEKIIADITGEMEQIFRREFTLIDESFRKTFLELFGGGKAALSLDDESDILNCGIEIKVQPPGKALTTLSLLSGGETAFVAIALYFAILKVRPAPFVVMDEIEAALDEANVDRYASYMRSMTDKTQFVVITHRRGTMEEADILYGVTMQEKGVSQVISVDLREAERAISK